MVLVPKVPTGGNVSIPVHGTPTIMSYTVTIESFKITDTRSIHNDTDFVALAVKVGDRPPVSVPTKSIGDVNNGTHQVGLAIPDILAGPSDIITITYSIVNSGFAKNDLEQAMQKAVTAAANKAAKAGADALAGYLGDPQAGPVISSVGQPAVSWIVGKLESIIFANCDGPVAGGEHTFTGAKLAEATAKGTFFQTDDNKGSDSPVGCGANSRYYVNWSVRSHPAQ